MFGSGHRKCVSSFIPILFLPLAINSFFNPFRPIDATIRLSAPRPIKRYSHSVFQTSIKTFNAELRAAISHEDDTPPAELHLQTQNNLAKTHITLDAKYQGTFNVQTKLASATVEQIGGKEVVADPLGNDRPRGYELDQFSTARVFGWIGWGDRPPPKHHQGYVEIISSHSPVLLELDGFKQTDESQLS